MVKPKDIQELKEEKTVKMGGLAKEEIKDRTRAMDARERLLTVRNIPDHVLWDELRKRYEVKTDIIRNARAALMVTVDDIDEME